MDEIELTELLRKRKEAHIRCIAMHEAGHAMLANALGVSITQASIEGVDDLAARHCGFVKFVPGYSVCDAIVIALSGRAVDEVLSDPPCISSFLVYETDDDVIRECLKVLHANGTCTPEQSAHYWRNIPVLRTEWVASWIVEHGDAIRAFASALGVQKLLEGRELTEALRDAWNGSKPDAVVLHSEVGEQVTKYLCEIPS